MPASGRGVFETQVLLTGQNGVVRYARTNPFGFYRFADAQAGQTVAINVLDNVMISRPEF